MKTIFERLTDLCAAGARLTCTSGINSHQQPTSFFRFVSQHLEKVRPPGIVDGLSEHPPGQSFDVEIFDGNQPKVVDQSTRHFVVKIRTLIKNVRVNTLKYLNRFAPAVRSFLTPRHTPLGYTQFRLGASIPTWIVDRGTIRERRERGEAHVNTYGSSVEGQWLRVAFDRKYGIPSSGLAPDRKRLHGALNRPVQFYSYVAYFRDAQPVALQDFSNFSKSETGIAKRRSKSWITWTLAPLYSTKESFKCLIDPRYHVFQNLGVNSGGILPYLPNVGKLVNLIKAPDVLSFKSPCVTAFLQRGVVEFTTERQRLIQRRYLPLGWVNPVSERFEHVGQL
jgi:hypothetical protein